jgi:uncharacterized membrane protein
MATKKVSSTGSSTSTGRSLTLDKVLPYLLIFLSIIGLICAFVIMFEKIKLLQDPSYQPACSINPIISCGSVMESDQSHIFGFPNPIIGLAAFPMVFALGVLMLGGATRLKRWVWLMLQAGTVFGLLFVHWLFFESVFRIQALCPYCMVVWTITIAMFWYVLLYNFRSGHIKTPSQLSKFVSFIQRHHADILVLWYLIIATIILHHFWYYFGTLI